MGVLEPASFLRRTSDERPQECPDDTQGSGAPGQGNRSRGAHRSGRGRRGGHAHRAQVAAPPRPGGYIPSLADRSSRPHRISRRSDASKVERALALRRTQGLTYERIAERVGLSCSTVGRACRSAGLTQLPALQERPAGPRCERSGAGELLHLDTKKLGCFHRPGHRVTGDRAQSSPHAGWQALHVAIDDHSRVSFSQALADETSRSACAFLVAALRYCASLGVRVRSVMTDNGSAYKARRFTELLHRLRLKHLNTRPYTPRTNGKAERFIQTSLREWAYACVYPSSRHRTEELPNRMRYYHFHRPHGATAGNPPSPASG